MSADFWAGYISGAAGILIGNPLDLIKVRLQAGTPTLSRPTSSLSSSSSTHSLSSRPTYISQFTSASSLIRGATAPILGYGALNALLFPHLPNLWTTFLAGALGGLATWVVSTPTELIKCRAQLSTSSSSASSFGIAKEILRTEGVKGLYFGGVVTALRDSVGYGFYFWSYELSTRILERRFKEQGGSGNGGMGMGQEAAKVLLCGGLAGVVTWASIFPLDVIKTRVQTQVLQLSNNETSPLLASENGNGTGRERVDRRRGAIEIAKTAYRNEGASVFFKGLMVCSIRAFMVNAVQWAVYEWMMRELDPERKISLTTIEKTL
ncbi:mitochondrial carrier [Acephala macrosclerotiorum]|nr:mitochondrial carrier [Acephala macrosclerotiorum]